MSPETPIPPATTRAPVVGDVELVVFAIVTGVGDEMNNEPVPSGSITKLALVPAVVLIVSDIKLPEVMAKPAGVILAIVTPPERILRMPELSAEVARPPTPDVIASIYEAIYIPIK
jgi:hypothetical protein